MYMTTDRRPRIPAEIADKIDKLREELPFEYYVRDVLQTHIEHRLGTDLSATPLGVLRHEYEDPDGATLDVYRDAGEAHDHDAVIGLLVVSSEFTEAVGVYLDEAELRALRDVCTELLGEI